MLMAKNNQYNPSKNRESNTLTSEFMIITPAMASAWLSDNKFDNRNLTDRLVDKIARDIKENKWVVDGSAIRFDKKGNVIDGQHRLWAIVTAGKPIESLVIHGLSEESKDIIDTGKTRSNSDILHFHGYVNTASLANACRLSIGYKKNEGNLYNWASGSSKLHCSSSEIVAEAESNRDLVNCHQKVISYKFIKKFIGLGTASFCLHIFSKLDKRKAEEFFYLLEKGENLKEGDPILALRNSLALRDHLTMKLAKGGNYRTAYLIALVIKAWNAYRNGKQVKRLYFGDEKESYPYPL